MFLWQTKTSTGLLRMNIILLGPQGSGKGTQAQLLKEKYGFKHIATGDLIREGIKNEDPAALQIKESIAAGNLASDELVIELVKKSLSAQGNLFDGFPRTLPQAEALDEITHIDLVIELAMSDEIGVQRLSTRRQCKKCNTIFGAANPPRQEGICDGCEGEIYQRDDDKPDAIRKRLATYRDETEPLLEYYKPRELVHSIDASKSIDDIFAEIQDIIQTVAGQTQ